MSPNFTRRDIMKLTRTLNFVKFAACMVLVVGLSASALASCGDSLSAMAAGAASVHSQSRPMQQNSQSAGDNSGKSMVGLWHIQFTVGGQTIQEAYQLWNAGGTEVHNPNVDPRCFARLRRAAATARLFPVVCLRSCTRFQEARERSSGELLSVVYCSQSFKGNWREIAIALIDDWVSICELGLFSCQFHCWSRTSTAYRVINVSLLSSSNASRRPFSQHSSGTSMRALFSRQVVDVI